MDIAIEKSHTPPPASKRADHNNGEKGSEETMKPQTPQASEGAEHNDVEKGSEQLPAPEQDETQFPKGVALTLIIFSIWLALFLVALVSLTIALPLGANPLLTNIRTEPS
jgi:hypothetical protein